MLPRLDKKRGDGYSQPMNVFKFSIPEIFFGRGSLKHAGMCARNLGAKKIFFVSDEGLENAGWVDEVLKIFKKENLDHFFFSNVVSNPRDVHIEEGAEHYRRENCDVVMALGGGSPMDTAKGVALLAGNGGRVRDYEGANRISRPLPPMVFIPSTAGGCSDISQFAIITDVERQVKMSLISRNLVPNVSIIDPVILTTNTQDLIIESAVDALAHAVESYLSKIAFSMTESLSLKAIRMIFKNLPIALETGSLDSLEQLSIASTSAGMAFSNASLGLEHALAHSLGGKLDLVHGRIHSVMLPPVLHYNLPCCVEKLSDIGENIMGRRLSDSESTAMAAIEEFEKLFRTLGVPTRLREIVSDRSTIPQVCKMAVNDACLLSTPRSVTCKEMVDICEKAW